MFDDDLPRTIQMIEGHESLVNMTAKANPDRVVYQWIKDTDEGPRKIPNFGENSENAIDTDNTILNKIRERIFCIDGVLNITNVLRKDAGFYTIKANNAEGFSQTKIKLEILYQPR